MTTPPPMPPGGAPPYPQQQSYPQPYPPQQYPPQQGYPQQPGYPQEGYPPGYPQPGTFAAPPPISYATPPPAGQHNLNAKLIAVIIAAVVIVGGGVGAAFALSGGKSDNASPAPVVKTRPVPNPGPSTKPAPNPGPSTKPAPGPSTKPAPSPSTKPNPNPNPKPAGNTITIVGPITVTPQPGWQVEKRETGLVILASGGTQLFLNVYRAQSTNITQDLVSSIETFTKGTTGLRFGKASPPSAISGRNFAQSQDISFQFQVSTQQGTATVEGLFVEFLNPQTRIAEFCVYASTSNSALQAKAHEAVTMIASTE